MAKELTEKTVAKADNKPVKKKRERKFHPARYFKEMIGEVKKLTWLTAKDLAKHTAAVLIFVLAMALVIYVLDIGFSAGVQGLSKLTNTASTSETADNAQ